ncbi:MAG: hypothetical protein JWQ42_276 [Edaphobacter sp.]|nr:hypothetical protein [Edaphobacter sp.]
MSDLVAQSLGKCINVTSVEIGKKYYKLFSPESRNGVRRSNIPLYERGNLGQYRIASVMTIRVIDGLEIVNVEDNQA